MVKYLQMDGVDDRIVTPSTITYNKIVIDAYVNSSTAVETYFIDSTSRGTGGYIRFTNTGAIQTTGQTGFALNARKTTTLTLSAAATMAASFFSRYTPGEYASGSVYDIKFYNGTTLVAWYDMSTGTVQDQSGNGNHATLTGGTWLDDGTVGTPTGTDGTTAFDVKQSIYSDSSVNADTKLSLYSDSLTVTDTKQALYQDSSFAVDSKQTIYSDSVQAYDSKQILYSDSFTLFDTLQDLIDNTYGTTTFDVQVILYADSQTAYDTKQACYTEDSFQSDLLQILKEPAKPVISEMHLFGSSNAVTRFTGKNDAPITIRTKNTTSIHLKGGIQ